MRVFEDDEYEGGVLDDGVSDLLDEDEEVFPEEDDAEEEE